MGPIFQATLDCNNNPFLVEFVVKENININFVYQPYNEEKKKGQSQTKLLTKIFLVIYVISYYISVLAKFMQYLNVHQYMLLPFLTVRYDKAKL